MWNLKQIGLSGKSVIAIIFTAGFFVVIGFGLVGFTEMFHIIFPTVVMLETYVVKDYFDEINHKNKNKEIIDKST